MCVGGHHGACGRHSRLGTSSRGARTSKIIIPRANGSSKMKIFHDIALEARQATIDRATGVAPSDPGFGNQRQRPIPGNPRPSPSSPSSSSSSSSSSSTGMYDSPAAENVEAVGVQTSPSSWSSEAALDRQELERERARSVGSGSGTGVASSSSSSSPTKSEREAGSTAWDRLRKDAFPSVPVPQVNANAPRARAAGTQGGAADAERSREQAAFDALLEKERAGGEGDKWA